MNQFEKVIQAAGKALSELFGGLGFVLIVFQSESCVQVSMVSNTPKQELRELLHKTVENLDDDLNLPPEGNA